MKWRVSAIIVPGTVGAILFASGAAHAQSIDAAQQLQPERFVNKNDLGQGTRPSNLNPTGINYADCMEDMVFAYTVSLSGFSSTNSDNMQVWASFGQDCSLDANRGLPDSSAATCWLVDEGLTQQNVEATRTYQSKIPVRALVGVSQNNIPKAGTLVTDQGPAACSVQTSFAAVPITVWFLPLMPNGRLDESQTAASYQAPTIEADLVGPPPPVMNPIQDGDTLFVLSWTPNGDTDTAGYDVFIDPPPGSRPIVDAGFTAPVRTLYCPDTGASDASTATGADDAASEDALSDATETDVASDAETGTRDATATVTAGCYYVNTGNAQPQSNSECTSSVLTTNSSLVVDSGRGTAVDGGNADDASDVDSGVATGGGGISTIPCEYLVGATCPAASPAYTNIGPSTVTGETGGAYTITGLANGTTYDVVVAAVDGSGNVGPLSNCVLDFPAPANDFFTVYHNAGGQAGGSFCALEAVGEPAGLPIAGVAFGAAAFALTRRRREGRH
jgi:hypothetical protein